MPATVEGLGLHAHDLVGKTVLNIGSSRGDLCVTALERGSIRALGIELCPDRIQEARAKAHAAGSSAEFIEADFESCETHEKFDVVICSNVLHQLLDPLHALRRMMQTAREMLVIEFTAPSLQDGRKYNVSAAALLARRSALIAPAFPRYNADTYSRTFLLTPRAIKTILDRHAGAFEPVRLKPLPRANRHVATARKWQIQHLTVIAGPTASGKGSLYRALDADFRRKVGIPDADSGYVTATRIADLAPGRHSHVVLHYDMLRPFETSLRTYQRDIAADLMQAAKQVTFLTIFADSDRLQRQITASEIDNRRPGKQSARHLKLRELYRDPEFLAHWYHRWLQFSLHHADRTAGSYFVHNRGDYTILPASADTLRSLFAISADCSHTKKGS